MGISMLKNVNKLQNVDTCLHFPLTQVGIDNTTKPGSIHNQADNDILVDNFQKRTIQVTNFNAFD